ncbi:MAG: hypothetical protein MJE77_04825 [Proteobacteria bacterium]|nr:hypothetical protein [Pseudomonadota bacterium]
MSAGTEPRSGTRRRVGVRRFIAAAIVALGLSFAQPAIAPGQLFRVGEVQITTTDDHNRIRRGAEAPLPEPDQHTTWFMVVWVADDFDRAVSIPAVARGDPTRQTLAPGFRTNTLPS